MGFFGTCRDLLIFVTVIYVIDIAATKKKSLKHDQANHNFCKLNYRDTKYPIIVKRFIRSSINFI